MVQHTPWRSPVFNNFHSPADCTRESSADGINAALSTPVQTPFPFASLVLSANYRAEANGYILLEAQVREGDKWSDFYKMGLLSPNIQTSFPAQEAPFGRLETDELVLAHPASAYRFRVKSSGGAQLERLAACGVRAPFAYDEKNAARLPAGSFEKEVTPLSQMTLKHPDRRRVCSPVSVCMILNALGVSVTLADVLRGVYDPTAGIYGNWMFNTAYAGMKGVAAYVRRFGTLAELKDFVTQDSLVAASVAYERGQLPGAAIDHTAGHLLVIRGWKDGKVLVADPAASDEKTVLRAYPAREFANAWLNRKRGAAYIVRKK